MNNIRDLKNQNNALKLLREFAEDVERHLIEQIADAYPRKRKNVVYPIRLRNRYLNILWKLFLFWMEEGRRLAIQKVDDAIYRLNVQELTDEQLLQKGVFQKRAEYDKWVKRHLVSLEKKRFKDTVRRAQKAITTGIEQGLSSTQVQNLLRKQFRKYSEGELNRVVTTEYTRAVNLGQLREYNTDPVVIGYQPRVNYKGCPICDAIEAEGVIPKSEIRDFPPYHPWCQCTIEPVFPWDKEAEGLVLRGPPEGFIPETAYFPKYVDPTLPIEQQILQVMQYRWQKTTYAQLTDKDVKNLKWMWKYVFRQKGDLPDLTGVPIPKLKKIKRTTRKPKPLPKKETEPIEKPFEPPPVKEGDDFWKVLDGKEAERHKVFKDKLYKELDAKGFFTEPGLSRRQKILEDTLTKRTPEEVKKLSRLDVEFHGKDIGAYFETTGWDMVEKFTDSWNTFIGRFASDSVHKHFATAPIRITIHRIKRANSSPWRERGRHVMNFQTSDTPSAVCHEFGHTLEWNHAVNEKAINFRFRRIKKVDGVTEPPIDLYPWKLGRDREIAFDCGFPEAYAGKKYPHIVYSGWDGEPTEIFSMGLQYVRNRGAAAKFAKQDFDYFSFVVGVLQGAI